MIACASTFIHVGDDRLPIALLPLHDRDPLERVANRAARLHQLLAGAARQWDGRRDRRARSEIGDEVSNDGVGLARRQLRAAQHHVVDVAPPSHRAVAPGHDDAQAMALRARRADEVAAFALRQRRGLSAERRAGGEQRASDRANERDALHHTRRERACATE